MNDCIFCKIIKGDIPCEKVYEDDTLLAFLDIKPVNPGHFMIIPKEHHEMIQDTPDELVSKVFVKAKSLINPLKEATGADFVALSVVGIDVPHFHVHLVPRFKDDGLANFWPTKEYKEGEAKEIVKKIKEKLV